VPTFVRSTSLFDRSEYLDISDSEEDDREIASAYKQCVKFDMNDFDEDW
jgi:hypothetical protein